MVMMSILASLIAVKVLDEKFAKIYRMNYNLNEFLAQKHFITKYNDSWLNFFFFSSRRDYKPLFEEQN